MAEAIKNGTGHVLHAITPKMGVRILQRRALSPTCLSSIGNDKAQLRNCTRPMPPFCILDCPCFLQYQGELRSGSELACLSFNHYAILFMGVFVDRLNR
jgi:hypothetical protein